MSTLRRFVTPVRVLCLVLMVLLFLDSLDNFRNMFSSSPLSPGSPAATEKEDSPSLINRFIRKAVVATSSGVVGFGVRQILKNAGVTATDVAGGFWLRAAAVFVAPPAAAIGAGLVVPFVWDRIAGLWSGGPSSPDSKSDGSVGGVDGVGGKNIGLELEETDGVHAAVNEEGEEATPDALAADSTTELQPPPLSSSDIEEASEGSSPSSDGDPSSSSSWRWGLLEWFAWTAHFLSFAAFSTWLSFVPSGGAAAGFALAPPRRMSWIHFTLRCLNGALLLSSPLELLLQTSAPVSPLDPLLVSGTILSLMLLLSAKLLIDADVPGYLYLEGPDGTVDPTLAPAQFWAARIFVLAGVLGFLSLVIRIWMGDPVVSFVAAFGVGIVQLTRACGMFLMFQALKKQQDDKF